MRRFWIAAALAATPLLLVADDAVEEYGRRVKKIEQDEALGRVSLARHCENTKMWKEAVAEWTRVLDVFPDNKEAQESLTKAQERADVVVSRPTEQQTAQYAAGLLSLKKATGKRWRELSAWAKSKGLEDQAAEAKEYADEIEAVKKVSADPRQQAVDWLNGERRRCKLKPVTLSEALSDGAQKHCEYLVRNEGHPATEGLKAHEEDKSLPGYTPEGAKAGMQSDLGHSEPPQSMRGMLGTFYHRIPLLHPELREVGIGYAEGKGGEGRRWGGGGHCAIDFSGKIAEKDPKSPRVIAYPAEYQRGVARSFGGENPDPIPPGEDRETGMPITLTFFDSPKLADVVMEVRAAGVALDGYLSTPAKPARSDFPNEDTVCFIAKDHLPESAKIQVKVTAVVNGEPFAKEWEFTTGKKLTEGGWR
jgi:uncharacterized protein YkwD